MIWLLFMMNLWAQEVAIQSQETPDIKFEKFIVANPQYRTFVQHKIGQKNQGHDNLLADLKQAQFQFLQGSLEVAKKYFKNITEQQHKADWKKNERAAIHYSFLRLAQLEEDPIQQTRWLNKAVLFDLKASVDSKLYPPPLVAQYKKIKSNKVIQVWALPSKASQFSRILVNGRSIEGNTDFIRHQAGTARITFLSNQFLPLHFVTDMEKLTSIKLSTIPLASGGCQAPLFNSEIQENVKFILFDQDCTGQVNQALANTGGILSPKGFPKKTPEKKFYKSKWFWVGVSVLAAGLTWHSLSQKNQNNQQHQQPTATAVTSPAPREFSNE